MSTSTIVSGGQYLFLSNLSNCTSGFEPAPTVLGSTLMSGALGSRSYTANGSFITGDLSSWEFTVMSSGSSDNGNPGYLIKSGSTYLDLTQSVTGLCDKISPPIKFGGGEVTYRDYVSEPFSVLSANPRVWFWDGTRFYTKYTSDTKSIGSYVGGSSVADPKWRGYYYNDSTYGMVWVEWNTPWGSTRTDSDGSSQSGARYTNKKFYLMGMRPGYDSLIPSGLFDSTNALSRISGYQLYFGGRQCVAVSASEVGYEYDFTDYRTDFERKSISLYQRFVDSTPPSIDQVPTNIRVDAESSSGQVVNWPSPVATDAVDGEVPVVCSPAAGSTFPVGVTTVSVTATDAAGNSTSRTFTVTVSDTTGPAFRGVPGNMVVEATGPGGAVVTWRSPIAIDLVSGRTNVVCSSVSGSTFPLGVSAVSFVSIDWAGNISIKQFTITVVDTTGPSIDDLPADLAVTAAGPEGAAVSWSSPTATDVVDGGCEVVCSPPSESTFPVGVTTVVVTAADAAGNRSSEYFTVTVTMADTTGPSITGIPANKVVEATGPGGAVVSWTAPTSNDLVDGSRPVVCSPSSGSTFPVGVTTVTVTATDTAHNSSSQTFKVTVTDTTAPSITKVPLDRFVEATSAAGAITTWTAPVATDLVGGNRSVVCAPPSGSVFPIGVTTVTVTATDTAGNSSTRQFKVSVSHTKGPLIADVPDEQFVEATGPDGAIVDWPTPTAIDSVDGSCPVECSPSSGATFPVGSTLVTISSEDEEGNSSFEGFRVNVVDTQGPSVSGVPADMIVSASGPRGATVKWSTPRATDVVDGEVTPVCSPPSGSTFPVGVTTVTVDAVDAAGNSSISYFKVTVLSQGIAKVGTVLFPVSSATLTSAGKGQLRRYARLVAQRKYRFVYVRGFTSLLSGSGASARMRSLSSNRAKNAAAYLKSQLKAAHASLKVTVAGYGSAKPVATNKTKSGRAKNSRVELWAK